MRRTGPSLPSGLRGNVSLSISTMSRGESKSRPGFWATRCSATNSIASITGDVTVPSLPAQRLIIGQAELTFGVLEDALHPIAVPLHLGQTQRLRVSWGVGQAVLDRPRKGAYLTQLQGFRSDKY